MLPPNGPCNGRSKNDRGAPRPFGSTGAPCPHLNELEHSERVALSYLLRHIKLDLLTLFHTQMLVWGHLFAIYKRLQRDRPAPAPDSSVTWGNMAIVRSGRAPGPRCGATLAQLIDICNDGPYAFRCAWPRATGYAPAATAERPLRRLPRAVQTMAPDVRRHVSRVPLDRIGVERVVRLYYRYEPEPPR